MNDIGNAIYEIKRIDDLGYGDTSIHKINPSIKIVITLMYIIRVILLEEFNLISVPIVMLYPIVLFTIGKIPAKVILKKLIFVLPIVLGIAIINLIIDFSYNQIVFSLLLLFKCTFSLIGGLLLIVTTGMNQFSLGLRKLKVPKIMVIQVLLLYRYIVLMMEEASIIKSAYELRTLEKKAMTISDWGLIIGQMLLRSIEKSEKIYGAMKLRGFDGEYYVEYNTKIKSADIFYLVIWGSLFIISLI